MIHLAQHNRLHVSLPAGLPAGLPASLPACPPAPALHHVILKTWTSVFSRLRWVRQCGGGMRLFLCVAQVAIALMLLLPGCLLA